MNSSINSECENVFSNILKPLSSKDDASANINNKISKNTPNKIISTNTQSIASNKKSSIKPKERKVQFQSPDTKGLSTSSNLATGVSTRSSSNIITPYQKSDSSPSRQSYSSSREAARQAKIQNTAEKIIKVAELKEKWSRERERKSSLHQDERANSLQKIQECYNMKNEVRKKNLDIQKSIIEKQKFIEQDQLQSSLEDRAFVAAEKERLEKERRRQSTLLNYEILKRGKEKEFKINELKKQEEISLFEKRRQDYIEVKSAQKLSEVKKRQSLAIRAETHKKQKEIENQLEAFRKEEELALIEFRKSLWTDNQTAAAEEIEQEKEWFRQRALEWKREREYEKRIQIQEELRVQEELQKRREDWLDIQNYKLDIVYKNRESLSCRLDYARQQKKMEDRLRTQKEEVAEIERQLKLQEAEDIAKYRAKQKESARKSLAARLDQARYHRKLDEGFRVLKSINEQEDRMMRIKDDEAVRSSSEKARALARLSIAYRHESEVRFYFTEVFFIVSSS
jgi:hypothetical protein